MATQFLHNLNAVKALVGHAIDNLEEKYNQMEETCSTAVDQLCCGKPVAFAIFAKNLDWYADFLRQQVQHELKINKKEYTKWANAYRNLPKKTREEAEAKLLF